MDDFLGCTEENESPLLASTSDYIYFQKWTIYTTIITTIIKTYEEERLNDWGPE